MCFAACNKKSFDSNGNGLYWNRVGCERLCILFGIWYSYTLSMWDILSVLSEEIKSRSVFHVCEMCALRWIGFELFLKLRNLFFFRLSDWKRVLFSSLSLLGFRILFLIKKLKIKKMYITFSHNSRNLSSTWLLAKVGEIVFCAQIRFDLAVSLETCLETLLTNCTFLSTAWFLQKVKRQTKIELP